MFNGHIGGNFKNAKPIELIMIDDNACATSVGWPWSRSLFKIRDGKNIEIKISSGHEIVFTKLVSESKKAMISVKAGGNTWQIATVDTCAPSGFELCKV